MKRLFSALAVLAVAAAPLTAYASVFVARDEYATGPQDRINTNLYVASGTVSLGAPVQGDLVAVGGNVSALGRISGDVLGGGGNVQLLGSVDGDIRVGGGSVSIGGTVGGDVVMMGGVLHILPGATVRGDVYAMGGQFVLDGTVQGVVHMNGGRFTLNGTIGDDTDVRVSQDVTIGSDAVIRGAFTYKAPKEAQVASGARITGPVTYTPSSPFKFTGAAPKGIFFAIIGALTAVRLLAMLGLTALIVWLWRKMALDMMQEAKHKFWSSAGAGLVYGILGPIAAVLLLISFVGSLAGGLLLLVLIGLMIMAKALAGMLLGAWLAAAMAKRAALQITWRNALGGVILLEILSIIPILGWLLGALLCLAVFGVMAKHAQKQLVG